MPRGRELGRHRERQVDAGPPSPPRRRPVFGAGPHPGSGGDIDDRPAAPHTLRRGPSAREGRDQVQLEHVPQLRVRGVRERPHAAFVGAAGVVHPDVETTETVDGRLRELLGDVLAQIAGQLDRAAGRARVLARGHACHVGRPARRDDDVRSGIGQRQRDRRTDAAPEPVTTAARPSSRNSITGSSVREPSPATGRAGGGSAGSCSPGRRRTSRPRLRVVRRPFCTASRLNSSWSKTRASEPSDSTAVRHGSSALSRISGTGGRSLAGERGEEKHLHDAAAVIVAVGPEPVGDLVVAAPRVHVREHRQVVAVDEFGVGQLAAPRHRAGRAANGEPPRRVSCGRCCPRAPPASADRPCAGRSGC